MIFNLGSSLKAMMTVKKCVFCSTQSSNEQKSKNDTQNSTNNSSPEEEIEEHKKLFHRIEKLTDYLYFNFSRTKNSHILLNNYFVIQEIPTPPPIPYSL